MDHKIRVMLVEDDSFWRERLFADLNKETDIEIVKAAATKREALEEAGVLDVDVVLMDINLTENQLDGLETTKELMIATQSKVKVIMLTSLTEKEIIVKAFQNGAVNYINKSSFPDIVRAIREAYADQASIHPDAALVMREEIRLMLLSPSEREIHDLKERGYSRTEISELLNKSLNTIKTQIRSVRSKLLK
ncbi:response regulator transcription factor [Paenibacillus prosopidis]|uniref:LuxR family two component transcriptional regulator n=1 Tax=Paenibacillus prosopidis TaxID=630520 RepID=A0A368W7L9_9BACL|nr:response regulator transcription factor [Paenibacillus prosopidis]RCW51980.1 LuxR family two component transcriptional regulator [Paenibacillus prosopidis]